MAEPESTTAPSRGAMYTAQEDLMIAQAFCAASEDSVKGNYQKGDVFKETMRAAYTELCIEYSKQQHANLIQTCMNNSRTNKRLKAAPVVTFTPGMNMFSQRNAESVMKRFKTKIAKDCMAFLGITTAYPMISGESEGDLWTRWMATFELRNPDRFKYELAYHYLKDKPKWTAYCMEQKALEEKPPARPKGVKAAKRAEADKARVARLVKELSPGLSTTNRETDAPTTTPSPTQPQPGDGSLMAMFKETSDAFSKISYMLAVGQMSPETKASVKASAKLDVAAKELDLEMKKVAHKKEMLAVAAMEREAAAAFTHQSTTPSAQRRQYTTPTPTPAVASLPDTSVFEHTTDSDSE
jgi:hypothetical protein